MSDNSISIMGLFTDEDRTVSAIRGLKNTSWSLERVHSPFPSHKIMDALNLKKSPVGWFTLVGGIIGFFTGFALAIFTSVRWDLIVSGKPIVPIVPFIIVGFEFTILFSVFGNIVGLITQSKLPDYRERRRYDPRCSGGHFGVIARCPQNQQTELRNFFRGKGAEIKTYEH